MIPQTALDINGDLALRPGSITLGAGAVDNIDLAPTPYSFYNLFGVGFQSMSGFSGGKDGRVVTLHNSSNFSFTLLNNSSASLPENQIVIPGGGSLGILGGGSVTMMYSRLTTKWNIVSSIIRSVNRPINGTPMATPALLQQVLLSAPQMQMTWRSKQATSKKCV